MTKLSYWLAGAASVLAALFANAAPVAAASSDASQADKQDVPDVSSAARKQIEEKAAPMPGRDNTAFAEQDGPMFAEHKRPETIADPSGEKGAPGADVMAPSSGSDPNPPPSSRIEKHDMENPVAGVSAVGGEKANDPAGDPLGPGFIEIPEPKRDERSLPAAPDVQGAFDKNQLPQAPAGREGN